MVCLLYFIHWWRKKEKIYIRYLSTSTSLSLAGSGLTPLDFIIVSHYAVHNMRITHSTILYNSTRYRKIDRGKKNVLTVAYRTQALVRLKNIDKVEMTERHVLKLKCWVYVLNVRGKKSSTLYVTMVVLFPRHNCGWKGMWSPMFVLTVCWLSFNVWK